MAEGEINNLTMEKYLALTRGNQAPGVVKPEIGGNVNFKIKSQFMQELREDTFSKNKNDDAHEHVDRVLDIRNLFNLPGVLHDAVMLHVFPITLAGAAKRWVDRLPLGTVNSWDFLKKAFIQRYCPPSKTVKQLEEIRNFKQEGDKTLYQAWERYNDLLYKCPTYDINNHQKVNIFDNGLGALNRQLLDSHGPISGMTPVQALTFGRPSPFGNGAKYRVGPPGYYIRMENRPPVGEKRPSLEELMNKHLEESMRIRTEMEEWAANEINSPSLDQCKAVYADKKTSLDNGRHEISIAFSICTQIVQTNDVSPKIMPCQLQPKELNPGKYTLPCTIGSLNFYAMMDLDMTKRSPIGIVENVLVKIDKFLFPSDFVVTKRSRKKPRKLKLDINLPNKHFSKPVKQILEGELKFWLTCDPNIKECNGGHEIYEMNKEVDLKRWYCYYDDDRKRINGASLSFLEFLLDKYGENHEEGLIWDKRFEEWCINNPNTPTSRYTKDQENLNPRPKDYPFMDWLLTKVGHTNVSEPVKKSLLKIGLIDCFQEDVVKDLRESSFDDYKWMFDLEIDQLVNEYELGIGNKGHMLEDIWENCRKVQGDNTYWWHDKKSEEEERRKLRINIEEYERPMVHVETFKVKRYSFNTGQSFICVTKELIDALPMGRENGSRFRDMICKEVDSGRRIHRQT
ncbi:BYPASS-related protein [Tanacetum coccineum]|uniref:BYPASS-related protein n=1 Tax=Tanacetum coccineum TaxID=301880 RepID=A0ABQ5H3Q5_9ASTR